MELRISVQQGMSGSENGSTNFCGLQVDCYNDPCDHSLLTEASYLLSRLGVECLEFRVEARLF